MSSLGDVFRILNRMQDEGLVAQYAVGGATAVLFYAEPSRTYDLDMFVTLEAFGNDVLAPLSRVYEWAGELQRQDLPLIARQRPLRPWERPWDVTP